MLKGALDECLHNCCSYCAQVCELNLIGNPWLLICWLTRYVLALSCSSDMLTRLGNLFIKIRKIKFMVLTSMYLFPTRAIWYLPHEKYFAYVSWLRDWAWSNFATHHGITLFMFLIKGYMHRWKQILHKYCLTIVLKKQWKRWHAKEAWPNKIKSVIKRSIWLSVH